MDKFLSWMLPSGASSFTSEIDWLYYLILVVTGIAFFVVEIALVVFLIRYRTRPGRKAVYLHGSTRAEVIWTTVTALVVVVIGVLSAPAWDRIKGRNGPPPDAMPLGIAAKQFEWNVTYPGADGKIGTTDDYTVRGQLHVPVDKPVVATLTSEDAIHSFFVPAFRIKQDAVPGMHIRVWFKATKPGQYELGCAELCGLGHYRMRALVTVHTQEDYDRWTAQQSRSVAQR
jgi:cytochrome c oxidase subunit 2